MDLLNVYHRLPPQLRTVAVNVRGFYLHTWRYGSNFEKLVEEALDREQWSHRQWECWKAERLAFVLNRAATRVPYYRNQWSTRRRKGDSASWEDLENWPILEKETVREKGIALVADDCNPRWMFHEHTSGTTGKSLDLWWSRATVRAWYALFEARCRRWYGVSKKQRWGILGGQLVVPVRQRQAPFWVWNAPLNQLYMSSYHLAPDLIPDYLAAIRRHRIEYLFGYTSSLYALATEILKCGAKRLPMRVAITNAEALYGYQRDAIAAAFQCPVRETYGMAEIVATASECNFAKLHLWPEVGTVEVLDSNQPVESGTAGDVVCTGLFNADMPLIRYRVGDRATLDPNTGCACKRAFPIVTSVEGRIDDVLYTTDGRRVGRLDPVFKTQLAIREAQIIQEALDIVRLRYVPAAGFTTATERSMVERLKERMGNIKVVLEPRNEIPREINGKFRAVICQLSDREKTSLRESTSRKEVAEFN
jgi:phenylacetate-CoA ligase